jgi:MobA/MobL family.
MARAVVHALTVAPEGAAPWASDPAALWNAVENAERRRDGQVARDYRLPIPLGFSDEQGIDLAEAVARFIAAEFGTPVSLALHRDAKHDAFGKRKTDGTRGLHAHLYFPTRPIKAGGIEGAPAFGKKLAAFRDQESGAEAIELLNAKWAELSNLIASSGGLSVRVDHRSYKRMGLVRTAEPALGQAATALERQGIQTRLGDALRAHREARDRPAFADTESSVVGDASAIEVGAPTALPPGISARPVAQVPPKLGVSTVVTPRPSASVRRAKYLSQDDWMQSPVAWEPPPVVGLAQRFDEVYVARAGKSAGGIETGVMQTVKKIQWFLNALVMVAKALLHLDTEFKRYSTARLDVLHDSDQKRAALADLRKQASEARKPYTPRMNAAHLRRLREIQTVEEELVERLRLSKSIEAQLEGISERAAPWRSQAIHDRRHLKLHLAELEAQDHQAIVELLAVANGEELPWLKLYTSKTEPTLSMQRLVDEAEAHERRTNRSTQRAYRPKK